MQPSTQPPKAPQRPHALEKHGHVRHDPYYWMRERENPEVLAYIEAENAYTEAVLGHTKHLQETLFEEMKGRLKPDDQSVPYRLDNYYYYSRYASGKEYPIFCRKAGSLEAEEEVILNVNELAEGHAYFDLGTYKVSNDHRYLAYAYDAQGRRIYHIRFKDLQTGETFDTEIPQITGNMTWANDNRTLFYSKQDPETLRSYQIYRHTLGTDPAEDVRVYEETDDTFRTYVSRTKSKRFIVISCYSTVSNEFRLLEADQLDQDFRVIIPRQRDHEYEVDHLGDHLYLLTNYQAKNFRLVRAPIDSPGIENWEEVIPHREDTLLEDIELFDAFLVAEERSQGLAQIRIMAWDSEEVHYLPFEEPVYTAGVSVNPNMDSVELRYTYQSLTTPASTYDYNMQTGKKTLLKEQPILGGFDKADYRSARIMAQASDGTQVPVSLVHHVDTPLDGSAPLLLYGYGSYGFSLDPWFSPARLSLLNRGFIFAMAHIRGGEEMGRFWYEEGKLLNKQNTFTDFICCADTLLEKGYTSPDRMFAMGGSAGGLLMGAVINQRPDLFRGVVAAVPFVDVMTTMLDDTIPLTTGEYDEWGNPHDKTYYDYMLSYSPYDQVKTQAYPHLLVTSGFHDSQVQYWEPTKWVAKLRDHQSGDSLILLHTQLEAGHGGASGRYETFRETALEYAFLLNLVPS